MPRPSGALSGLAKTMSMELGPDNIRVNVIQPGMVEGPRVERTMHEKAEAAGLSYDDLHRRAVQRISLRVTADDIAVLVVFSCRRRGLQHLWPGNPRRRRPNEPKLTARNRRRQKR
jgi:NAD(P)-dependent dehydrogenase (short-subunit alcohol dehydrogenase family)